MHDYNSVGLSLKAHPVSFLRGELDRRRVAPAVELRDEKRWPNGRLVRVAGLVLVRQRPGTASGVVFETIEDETGIANLIIRPRVYERYRRVAKHSGIVMAQGKVERQGLVVHVMVERMEDLSGALRQLVQRSRDFR